MGRSTDPPCVAFLIDAWTLNTRARFVVACLATVAMGVLVGALGAARRLVRAGRGGIPFRAMTRRRRHQRCPAGAEEDVEGGGKAILLLPPDDSLLIEGVAREAAWPAVGESPDGNEVPAGGDGGAEVRVAEDMTTAAPGLGRKAAIVTLYGSQLTLGYLLMLVAMTYHVDPVHTHSYL